MSLAIPLEEIKAHLRIEHSREDDSLEQILASAVDYAEQVTRRIIGHRTVTLPMDRFPGREMVLPVTPVQSVDSIQYTLTDGSEETLDPESYRLLAHVEPPILLPTGSWPSGVAQEPGAVRLVVEAGYTELPGSIRQALLLLVGHYYENREVMRERYANVHEMPFAVAALLHPYKILRW